MYKQHRPQEPLSSGVAITPDQGAAGVTWQFYRQAKMPRVQATYSIPGVDEADADGGFD